MTAASRDRLDRHALLWLVAGKVQHPAYPVRHRLAVARLWLSWRWQRFLLATVDPVRMPESTASDSLAALLDQIACGSRFLLAGHLQERLRANLAAARPMEEQARRGVFKFRAQAARLKVAIEAMQNAFRAFGVSSREAAWNADRLRRALEPRPQDHRIRFVVGHKPS